MFNVLLCGFMGCGKTSLAKLISKKSNLKFIDTDQEVEKLIGLTIPEIFKNLGENYFRKLESQILKQTLQQSNQIIATGGATLTFKKNLNMLTPQCEIIFIDTSFKICFDRIKNSNRPLVKTKSRQQLEKIFLSRKTIYEKIASNTLFEQTKMEIKHKLALVLNLIDNFKKLNSN